MDVLRCIMLPNFQSDLNVRILSYTVINYNNDIINQIRVIQMIHLCMRNTQKEGLTYIDCSEGEKRSTVIGQILMTNSFNYRVSADIFLSPGQA
jgi:hypothetical protein